MKSIHLTDLANGLSMLLVAPIAAWAQAPTAVPPGPPAGHGAPVTGLLTLVVLAGVFVGVVKLIDLSRERGDRTIALEARISDALLVHPALTGLPIHVVTHILLSRQSKPVIEVRGRVPTPAQREIALDVVRQELYRQVSSARIEDRIMVDPLMQRRAA